MDIKIQEGIVLIRDRKWLIEVNVEELITRAYYAVYSADKGTTD